MSQLAQNRAQDICLANPKSAVSRAVLYSSAVKGDPLAPTDSAYKKAKEIGRFDKLYKELLQKNLHRPNEKNGSAVVSLRDLALKKALRVDQIEQQCREVFKVAISVENIIVDTVPSSHNSFTTIFISKDDMLYALCAGDDDLQYADVKSIITSMGLEPVEFLPPGANKKYFLDFGLKKFRSYFPSYGKVSAKDTSFYQTLAPYSPALVRIKRIKGDIYEYNADEKVWQKVLKYSYRKIKVKFK